MSAALPLASSVLLAALAVCASGQSGSVVSVQQAAVPVPLPLVEFDQLVAKPDQYVGQEVRVQLQFHSLVFDWNPFMTRFAPTQYIGVDAWTDQQRLWDQADYEAPGARVFVDSFDPIIGVLLRAERQARIEVVCVVREFLAGEVWTEVTDIKLLPEYLPEGGLMHTIRARAFMQHSSWALAQGEFERALLAPVPSHVRRILEADAAICAANATRMADLRRRHRIKH